MSSNSLTIIGTTLRIPAIGTHVDQYGLSLAGDIPARSTSSPYNPTTADSIVGGATVGTSIAPFGALFLTSDAKIYTGTSEFTSGGGGGGGIEALALANAMDKQGNSYPLPNGKHIRNAYTSSSNMQFWLRKAYLTADTVTMIADHGLDSELETINDMETVGDFTAGTATPSVAANTTDKLENTQSVQFTATTLNGSADMYETVVLGLTDRHFRVSVYPNTLSSVTEVYVTLYTSSGNERKFSFVSADLTSATWNHLTCDLDDDTAYTDTGTFERSNITRIYYGITTSGAQTVVPSFDLARAISNKPLIVDGYSLALTMQDATNQETPIVLSEDRTDNTTKGTFTIDATLSNDYTNIETTAYASTTTGTISNNQLEVKSTASGQNAKTPKQHDVLYTNTTLSSTSMDAFLRWYDDSFDVTDLSSFAASGIIEAESATDEKARFLDDTYHILYKSLRGGYKDQSPEGSSTSNFWVVQLSANATYSDPTLTITMDNYLSDAATPTFTVGKPDLGADLTGYKIVPLSAYMSYIAGAKDATTITRLWPSEFLVNKTERALFSDDFNRADGSVGNDWTEQEDYESNASAAWTISSNVLAYSLNNATAIGRLTRNKEGYDIKGGFKIRGTLSTDTSITNKQGCVSVGSKNATMYNGSDTSEFTLTGDHGVTVVFRWRDENIDRDELKLYSGGALIKTITFVYSASTTYGYEMLVTKTNVKVKIWDTAGSEPDGYNIDEDATYNSVGNYFMYGSLLATGAVSAFSFDDLVIEEIDEGYTQKLNIASLSDIDNVQTIKQLDINDTTNQAPIIYEDGEQLT